MSLSKDLTRGFVVFIVLKHIQVIIKRLSHVLWVFQVPEHIHVHDKILSHICRGISSAKTYVPVKRLFQVIEVFLILKRTDVCVNRLFHAVWVFLWLKKKKIKLVT